MKKTSLIFGRFLALAFLSIWIVRPSAASAVQLTEPHETLTSQLGWPSPPPLSTGWVAIPAPPGMAFNVNIGATLGLTFASVSMDGSGVLNYSQYPGTGSLSFDNTSGTASMNIGFQTWANYQIVWQGNTYTGNLPILPSVDFRFADQKSFNNYMLGQTVTLSDTADDIPIVSAGTSDFGLPSDVADVSLGISLTPALQCNLSGVNLQTSLGTFYSAGDTLNAKLNSSSLTVSGISQTTHCDFNADITPDFTIEVSIVGLDVFDQDYPVAQPFTIPLASTDISTSPSQSVTFNLQSGGGSGAPVVSSVSPPSLTGLPIGQRQLIRIIGSGFTSSSTLVFNDGTQNYNSDPAQLTFVNPNEIDYNISTGTSQATWSVQVVNGSQYSNVKDFVVNAPAPSTGTLVVNLSPSNIGGQWQVNGSYYDSGNVVSLAPGQYTVSFKPVSGYTTPANQTVTIVANAQTTTNATYVAVAPTTYTLTLNANSTQGYVTASPTASGNIYNAGTAVQLYAGTYSGYHFTGWSGDLTGSISPTNITMSSSKNITANFASGDPNLATVTVTIKPDAAASAGVTWDVTGESQHRASGTSLSEAIGTGYTAYLPITLNLVAGWLGPSGSTSFNVPITAGINTNVTLTCAPNTTPGLLTVTLSPPDAVNAGAQWHVNGGAYGNGASVSLSPGTYNVTFDNISGWTAPSGQSVTIQPSGTAVIAGNYTPPAGQPAIISISPTIAANSGGTVMTINGANFATTTNVLIGGISASNIAVASATQITCLIPPSATNGSVPVVVQTTGGNATNSSGFAYGVPLGTNMSLVSAIGGNCYGVYVSGNYAYVGEGRNLVVLDISTPSNPLRKGQVTLPGIVYDIQLLNQRAYIADGNGGLQVLDVGDPTAPKIVGFYSPTNTWSWGISIYGGRAYVADDSTGLEIFSLANPTTPTLLSSTNIGRAVAVIVKASSSGAFAYVSDGNNLYVVDVSNPNAPVARGQTSTGDWGGIYALSSSGNYIFQADPSSGIHMIDVSNPDAPTNNTIQITGDGGSGGYVALAAANNYLYTESYIQGIGFRVLNITASGLTPVGQNQNLFAGYGSSDKMVISGNQAYVASGPYGLQIVNISNPANPSSASSFSDSDLYGDYYSVGTTGNLLFTTGNESAFKVFDISQAGKSPTLLTQVGLIANAGAYLMAAANGVVCVNVTSSADGLRVYNLANPSAPQLEYTIPESEIEAEDAQLVGTTLYVAGTVSSTARCIAVDVSNPSSYSIRSTKDFTDSFNAWSMAVSGSKALVALAGNNTPWRISLLDISNISSPVERGSITTTSQTKICISPDGNYAYYIDQLVTPSFVHVVNISDLSNPVTVTNVPIDAGILNMNLRGNELYVGTIQGLYVFDISHPTSPTLARSYSMSGISYIGKGICAPTESANQSSSIYIANEDGGIVSLQEQDIQSPEIYITDPIFGSITTTTSSSTELGGGSDDNIGVTAITWLNNRGGSGQVSPPLDNWYVSSIALYPGTNILTVTAYDAAGNDGTDTLAVVYQTSKQDQNITFPTIADHTFGDTPIQLTAAASSGSPVTFSVISGSASISNNVLTLTGAGAVTVEATQSGNDLFNTATPVDVSFNVARANQAITFAPLPDKSAGDMPFALSATTSSGLPVYFSILSGPAIINTNTVTLVGGGTVTIVAYQPGNSNYNAAATVQQSFNVSKIPQTITFGALSTQKVGDAPFPVNATASSGLPVSYSISGPATLSGNIVTLTGYGTVTVTASQAGNNTYSTAANVAQSFVVAPPDNTLVGLGFQNGGFQMAFYGLTGSNYTFKASSNLLDWQPFTNFILTDSPQYFTDPGATNYNRRFYRAVLP